MIQRSGTRQIPATQRLEYWNSLLSAVFPGMAVSGPDNIEAEWSSCDLDDITISLARSSKARVSRWTSCAASTGTGRGLIHLQSNGVSTTSQSGNAATLSGGDMTFCLADDPYEIHISDHNAMFVIDFPMEIVADRPVRPGLVVGLHSAHAGVLHDFIGSVLTKDWHDPIESEDRQAFRELVANLVRRSFREDSLRDAASREPQQDLRQRVLGFIEDYMDKSHLRTGLIADCLSVPPRAIQAIFAEMATTPTAYIIERRLARAAERLRSGRDTGSITNLALDLGFSDCAHFTRRFKARYGMSPSRFVRPASN